jgi:hypothetical protein
MLINDLLYQILLSVLIIAGVYLIFIFWRLYRILSNVDDTVEGVKNTIIKISKKFSETVEKFSDFGDNFKLVFKFAEEIATRLKDYRKKNSKEEDE